MCMEKKNSQGSIEFIEKRIFLIRGQKVMLSHDLAELYSVEPRSLIQAVKRNSDRFPIDFMFPLTWEESAHVKSQFSPGISNKTSRSQTVILKRGGNIKYKSYAFTEQGVAMLSTVLRSKRAVQVNIAIMRAFVRLREMLTTHTELAAKLKELEEIVGEHDESILSLFDAIEKLLEPPELPPPRIGFKPKK